MNVQFPDARIVHRLDMETSGLMILARSASSHRILSSQFQSRTVQKEYVACVAGRPGSPDGTIELPLISDWPNRPRQKVDFERGKPSTTHWRTISNSDDAARLLLQPVTGRSHQLRVHLNAIGHPILGDSLYGTPQSMAAAQRLQLHASRVVFLCPQSGQTRDFTCAVPF